METFRDNTDSIRFKEFMNNSPMAGWITENGGIMSFMNDKFLSIYGLTKADFGKSLYMLFPAQIAIDYHLNNLRVLKEGKPQETVTQVRLPDGREQVMKIYTFPLEMDGLQMIGGWAMDITREMELQEKLLEQEKSTRQQVIKKDVNFQLNCTTM
jgi:PAS domain S-box-containing protein